ncbi:MAG: VWA domain-containing protein [Bacteroidetes bacterium]|nr:VWA domain-containing protein [Bacteroidota bacterium]
MFQFSQIENLFYLLALVPIGLGFWLYLRWRKQSLALIGEYDLVKQIGNFTELKNIKRRFYLAAAAYVLLVLAMANPQTAGKEEEVNKSGLDIVFAIDISRSMQTRDVQPDRLTRTCLLAEKMIDNCPNDRIALVVFAGNAYLQMPLTSDHSAAKLFLNSLNTNMAGTQGTAIADAIQLGISTLDIKTKASKVMVLMSDGEETEGNAATAAKNAAKENIKIYTVGVGTTTGGLIPLLENGAFAGNYQLNEEGQKVVSRLQNKTMKEIGLSRRTSTKSFLRN